jgi:CBS domain containing-hemolysin-like protein
LERSTVDANARTGGRRDQLVQRAHRTLSFQLSGAQVGISVTTLITGYLAEPLIAQLLAPAFTAMSMSPGTAGGLALALALLIATSVSMVFGELVSQYLAVAKPLPVARVVAGPQVVFSALVTPLIHMTNGSANWILRRLGIEPAEELRSARSPQELGSLVRNSARQGSLDPVTATLVDRSLQFGSRTAEELMTPRTEIVTLQTDDTVADLVEAAIQSGHSRFPIVAGDLDETVGIVHVKQVFEVPLAEHKQTRLATLAQPVTRVPSTLDGDDVMSQLRANGLQTALVVDEYGGTAGMVTVEDVIEEIVGDIRDEHDEPTADVVRAGRGWHISGLLRIDEVAGATGFRAPDGEYETIGGLVLQQLGHIPEEGESVELSAFDADAPVEDPMRWLATVLQMDGRRIDQLELTKLGRQGDRTADVSTADG